jgi:HSP20 family protein
MARGSLSPYSYGADPFQVLRQEVDQLFDNMWRGSGLPAARGAGGSSLALTPHMDVSETDNEIAITADLPGVAPNDVSVMLNDDILTISGERKAEHQEERKNFHVMERTHGTFQRSLRLPFAVDPSQVQAHFEHGVLRVTLPKTAATQRSRRIEVRTGSAGASAQQPAIQPGDDNRPAEQAADGGQPAAPGVRH